MLLRFLILNFSFKYKKLPIINIRGLADIIIGALMLDEYDNPKFKNEIVKVIPAMDRKIKVGISLDFTFKFL